LWKDDSIGCLRYRDTITDILFKNKGKLIGENIDEINTLLGKPNSTYISDSDTSYFYITEPNPHCGNPHFGLDSVEVAMLVISFEEKKVKDVSIAIP
jgi:hypothetical protein